MPKHILVIDNDVELSQTYMTFLLGLPNWLLHVQTIAEGRQALAELALRRVPCALLFLNVNLPESLGLAGIVSMRAFIREISDGTPPVPVIALTGVDNTALREEIVGWGVREYYVMQEQTLPPLLPASVLEVLGLGATPEGPAVNKP